MENNDIVKISLVLDKKFHEIVVFGGNILDVIPYIELQTKIELIKNFVDIMNRQDDEINKYLTAKYGLMLDLIAHQTNMNIDGFTEKDADLIITSGLWDAIKVKIVNYNEIEKDIFNVIALYEQKKSIESSFSVLVQKGITLIDNVSKLDLSEKGITELVSRLQVESEKVKNFFPVVKTDEKVEVKTEEKQKRKYTKKDKTIE